MQFMSVWLYNTVCVRNNAYWERLYAIKLHSTVHESAAVAIKACKTSGYSILRVQ